MLKNSNVNHRISLVPGLLLLAITLFYNGLIHAQTSPSSAFGNTFIHSEGNLTIFGEHSFKIPTQFTGTQPGIIGAERLPTLGYFNFAPGATWVEADNTKYVDGYVRFFGNTRFLFPVGDNGSFRPAAVSGGAYVEAAYFAVDPTVAITNDIRGGDFPILPQTGPFDTSLYDDAIIKVSEYEYWDINGSDPTIITLTWDGNSKVDLITSNDLERLAIVGWNGAQWEYIPSYIDFNSINQANNSAMFTGTTPDYSSGSISTKVPVVPSSYEVYTLASSCLFMEVDVSNELLICLGETFTLSASSYDEAELVWNTGEIGPTITDSPTENTFYSVTATLGSCVVTREILVEVREMMVELGQDTFVCSGNDITIIAQSSDAGTYQWEHRGVLTFGNNSITLQNLNTPSTLNVTVTDSNGCTATDNLFINIRQSPDVFTGRDASVCLGDSTFIQAFGSVSGYGYRWSTGDTASLIWVTPLQNSTYEVSLTENGCSDVSFVSVEVFQQAYIEILNDNIICPGEEVIIETESTPGSYLWSNGDSTESITVFPVDQESYSVTLTSSGNCEWIDEIIFVSFETTLDLGQDLFICAGETVNLKITGIFDAVLWETGETSQQISVTPDTTTSYEVICYYGNCSAIKQITINVDTVLNVELGPDPTICRGETIQLGSNSVGQYNWSTGQNTSTIQVSPFSTTTFSVTVTSGGCIDEDQITVNVIEEAAFVEITTDPLFCLGEEVFLQASGSAGDYEWSNGNITNAFSVSPIDGSIYTVTVTNIEGCEATASITFEAYDQSTIDIGPDQNICIGEQVQLEVTGNYRNLFWSNGSTNNFINVIPLVTTSYYVTATLNGCVSYDTVTVNVTNLLDLELGNDITVCKGETVTLTVNNIGGQFEWSTGQTGNSITINPSTSGIYSVTATSGSCSATDEITIIVDEPFIEIITEENYCPGESLLLTTNASPGTIIWNNGTIADSLILFPSPGFSYSATVFSEEGCTANDIVFPTPFVLQNINLGPDLQICEGGIINIGFNGNYDSVLWSTGGIENTITVSPLQNESYSVSVTQGSCTLSDTISISVVESVEVELGPDKTICKGSSTSINSNINGTYMWSTGESSSSITVIPLQNTTYYLTVTSGLCESIDSITVNVENNPNVEIIGSSSICLGEQTTLYLDNPVGAVLWNTGETTPQITITPSPGQLFSVTVTSPNGCIGSDELMISSFNSGSIDLGPDIEICNGAEVILDIEGNFDQIQWSTGQSGNTITIIPTQTITITVTAWKETCQVSDNITIIVKDEINLNLGPNITICSGQEVELFSNIAGNYLWSTGDTSPTIFVSPTETTVYTATVQSGSCISADEITVIVENNAYANIVTNPLFCLGEMVVLDSEGSQGTYVWNTGETGQTINQFPVNNSTYYVTVTTSEGCVDVDSITMQKFDDRELFDKDAIDICEGETVSLEVLGLYQSLSWDDGSSENPRFVQPTNTTTYLATADFRSCSSTDEITVNVNTSLNLDLGVDIYLCEGKSVELRSNIIGQYLWNTGSTSNTISVSPEDPTLYTLTVTSSNCVATDSIWVFVEDAFVEILNNSVFCEEALVSLETIGSEGTYVWSTGESGPIIDVIPTSNQTYSVTITSDAGCQATDEITFTKYGGGDINLGPDITICQGGSTQLRVQGIFDYVIWSDGITGASRIVTPGNTTKYNVTAVYGSCLSFDQITVNVEENLNLSLGPDITICEGQTVELNDIDVGGNYLWSTGETTSSIIVNPTATTSYTVTVSSGICVDQDEIKVVVSDNCKIDLYLHKSSDNFNPETGDTIELSVLVGNKGEITATNIEVLEIIRSGFKLISHQTTEGTYNPNTSIWYLDSLETNKTQVLNLNVEVLTTGDYFNIAEVVKVDQQDVDSEPGNGDDSEDDFDKILLDVFTLVEVPDNTSEIGDRVWMDTNGDGYQDNSESGIENIEVQLFNSSNFFIPVETMSTGTNGSFRFTGLSSGVYFVKFIIPENLVITVPKFNGSNNTNFDDKDSDIENIFGYGTTNMINLEKGEKIKTCDGGLYPGGSIGDFVWEDALGGLDDRYDQMIDNGVEGVTLKLYDFTMDTFIRETVTDENGFYLFDNLVKGDYYLELVLPGILQHKDIVSPNVAVEDIDSDFNPFSMKTSRVTLVPGQHIDYIDAGLAGSLPLTLVDFWGERIYDDRLNRLFWTTESEFNTDKFIIERSLTQSLNFKPIGEVEAAGSSSEVLYYTFDDLNSIPAGEYYYRLKMIDLNGLYSYGPIIIIKVYEDGQEEEKPTVYKIFPIPTTDFLNLQIAVDQDQVFEAFLVNNLGQHVRTLEKQTLFEGNNLLNIDVIDLDQGQYYLNFYVGKEQFIVKVLILD